MRESKSGRKEEKEWGQLLNELFDQMHITGKVVMKQLQPLQTQCFGFSSPSQPLSPPGTVSEHVPYQFTYPISPWQQHQLTWFSVYKDYLGYWYYHENKPTGMLF